MSVQEASFPKSHPDSTEAALAVEGMDCASCVSHVEQAAAKVPGVQACSVNLARGRAVVKFDPSRTNPRQIADGARDAHAEHLRMTRQQAHAERWLRRAVVGAALWLPVELAHWVLLLTGSHAGHAAQQITWLDWAAFVSSTIAIVYVGAAFYRN